MNNPLGKPPAFSKTTFDCGHCSAFTHHTWLKCEATAWGGLRSILGTIAETTDQEAALFKLGVTTQRLSTRAVHDYSVDGLHLSVCFACKRASIWVREQLVWPCARGAALPSPDMPEEIRQDYLEASAIVGTSPRGASALLRLALQKLINSIVQRQVGIDEGIQLLVDRGLRPNLQKAFDVMRIRGNEAVHPGQLDAADDLESAGRLFKLLNIIVEQTITEPREISDLYSGLPPEKLAGIEVRERKAASRAPKKPAPSKSDFTET